MTWLALWMALLLVSGVGLVVTWNGLRLERQVALAGDDLVARGRASTPALGDLAHLPAPVARYLGKAIDPGRRPIRHIRLQHGGGMRLKPDASWLALRGVQTLTSDAPAFAWWGRVRVAPGVWIDARDTLVDGHARMLIQLASTVTLGNVTGAELDQGAMVRLLGEMMWMPTALHDRRYVTWTAIDDASAKATLRFEGREASAFFHFGPDGLPARVSADRYREVNGKSVLTPWTGAARDFRKVDGVLVPFEMDATWELEAGPFHCLHFTVDELVVDGVAAAGPFSMARSMQGQTS